MLCMATNDSFVFAVKVAEIVGFFSAISVVKKKCTFVTADSIIAYGIEGNLSKSLVYFSHFVSGSKTRCARMNIVWASKFLVSGQRDCIGVKLLSTSPIKLNTQTTHLHSHLMMLQAGPNQHIQWHSRQPDRDRGIPDYGQKDIPS